MGSIFGAMFSKLSGKKELKIIIIGLDNSGKTTILSILLFIFRQATSQLSQTNCPYYWV